MILSKPAIPTKGTPQTFNLFKAELATLVESGHYFANPANWKRIVLNYQSQGTHKQNIFVNMYATPEVLFEEGAAGPEDDIYSIQGPFFASIRALDFFDIMYIAIYDFDGGKYMIKRDLLPTSEFDVEL